MAHGCNGGRFCVLLEAKEIFGGGEGSGVFEGERAGERGGGRTAEWGGVWFVFRGGGVWAGACSFAACLRLLTIGHASLSKWGNVWGGR